MSAETENICVAKTIDNRKKLSWNCVNIETQWKKSETKTKIERTISVWDLAKIHYFLTIHFYSTEAPSNPGKPIQVAPFNNSAETLAIKWERPFTDGGSPIIGYLVEHRRIGSPAWVKTSATLVPFPEITMTGIEPNWRVQFRVFAQNVVGMSESSPISEPISIITQHTGTSAPQFLNELQNTTVLENDQCEFHVSVMGSPTPQINWFKDGFEIFSSRRTKIINEHGSSTLIFHQIALTDEGEIKCTATNRYGHVVTRFQLKIDAPPKIRLPRQYEDGYLVEAGETIKLKVIFSSIYGKPSSFISIILKLFDYDQSGWYRWSSDTVDFLVPQQWNHHKWWTLRNHNQR